MTDTEYTLAKQIEATRDLLAQLRADGAEDDAELVADSIEGQTNLAEAIAAALNEIDEAEILIEGGKKKIEQIGSRVAAEEKRVERIRAAIERAMVMTDLPKLKLPSGTISIAKRPAQPIIEDEAAIPTRFFITPPAPPPRIDKKALAAALRDGEAIPGAKLDNGSISLTLRRS